MFFVYKCVSDKSLKSYKVINGTRFFLKTHCMLDKILLNSRNHTRRLLIIRSMVLQTELVKPIGR